MMVRVVIKVDLADWVVEFVSEPMSEVIAHLLLIELSRQPEVRVLSARLTGVEDDAAT